MIQNMRDKMQGIVAFTIVTLLCITFALWGVQYYLHSSGGHDVVAKVNGMKITRRQLQVSLQRARQQLMLQEGRHFSYTQAYQQQLKEKVLKQLIRAEAFFQEAESLGFNVGMQQIDDILVSMPVFQVAGKFSEARFQQILSRMLFSESEFILQLKQNIIVNQLQSGIVSSSFVLPNELGNAIELLQQKRDIRYAIIPADMFRSKIKISANEIQSYYQKNKQQFTVPEKVGIHYLILDAAELKMDQPVTDKQLQQYYADNIDLYSHPERWYVSRIFTQLPANATRSTLEDAEAKINTLYKQAEQGVGFNQLDISYGQPTWMIKTQMPTEFITQLQMLNPGQISKPFRTDEGFFVIKLLKIEKANTQLFDQVKTNVKKAYIKNRLMQLFDQKSDQLSDLTYTSSTSLQPAAKKLNLQVKTTDLFTQAGAKTGLLANPKIVHAAFSTAVLKDRYNSDPIDLGANKVAVIRVNKYVPQITQPVSQVEPIIRQELTQKEALRLAGNLGEKLLEQIKQGSKLVKVAAISNLRLITVKNLARDNEKINSKIIEAAFDLAPPKADKASVSGLFENNEGYALVQLDKIYLGNKDKMDKDKLNLFERNYTYLMGMNIYNIYADELVKAAKITIFNDVK